MATKKTKWLPKHKIDHNSVNFQARSSRFCMVVHNVPLQIFIDKKQNGHQKTKWSPKTKLGISESILKLEAQHFAR